MIPRVMASFLDATACELLNVAQFHGKVFHIPVELFLGYLCINLRRFYALVPQHRTDRLDGHAVGKENRRCCRMSALVPGDMLGDAATFGDGTDSVQAGHVAGNGKYPTVLAQSPVFVNDPLCNVKQANIGDHTRLLTVDVYPFVFVEVGTDVFFRQVAHIAERQPRERTEQV